MKEITVLEKFIVCTVIATLCAFSNAFEYPKKALQDAYDYVVVGGGSSGAVVANRLSENGSFSVLLLEAGGVPPCVTEVPMFTFDVFKTEIEWKGKMEPQNNSCDMNPEGVCWWSRVRALGGCSSHNFMIYNRGNKKDFYQWERMGAKGWGYDEVLEVFKAVENHTDKNISANGYHGTDGLQTVSPLAYKTDIGKAYMEGGRQMGLNITEDYNGPCQTGLSYTQVSQKGGLRCSTEKAFLRPAAARSNLHICTHAYVLKVTFNSNNEVKSVIFDHNNQTKEVYVRKEVILSAGAVSSPALLLLSGIGPKEHLNEMKIPLVVDLPAVGKNLQDHPWVSLNYVLNSSVGIVYNRDVNPENIGKLTCGEGPLTSPAYCEINGFYSTKYQSNETDWPDILWHSGMAAIYPQPGTDFRDKNSTGFIMTILRPESRGFIKLKSSDPYQYPMVDPQYFSNPDDVKRLMEGVKMIMSLMQTPSVQLHGPQIVPKILPGCATFTPGSDEYIECFVRRYLGGGYHLAGSCKMGDPKDPTTVVDHTLRVLGVKGLRVADASIMPVITTSNLNAPCIMIGRKAADMILSGEQ